MSLSLAYQTITWRDDLPAALLDIAAAGFRAFETFSFPPRAADTWQGYVDRLARAYAERPETYLETAWYRTPDGLATLAGRYGLVLSSMYCSGRFIDPALVDHELAAILTAARFVRAAGCRYLILGGGMNERGVYADSDYRRLVEMLHAIGRGCREIGLIACYHPHSGTMVETAAQLARFCDETDPSLIALAPDVAHLVRARADPAATLRRYADRVRYLHLKDIRDNEFVELGEGLIDLPAVVAALRDIGYTGWVVVELDDTTRTPLESAIISRRCLEERLGVNV
ncbi:MAG: TIM barrel protein [Candidatus Latescibacteria bacterium]|nr:TIM barrel protein [Candidatus Latescibacterota bacterium]